MGSSTRFYTQRHNSLGSRCTSVAARQSEYVIFFLKIIHALSCDNIGFSMSKKEKKLQTDGNRLHVCRGFYMARNVSDTREPSGTSSSARGIGLLCPFCSTPLSVRTGSLLWIPILAFDLHHHTQNACSISAVKQWVLGVFLLMIWLTNCLLYLNQFCFCFFMCQVSFVHFFLSKHESVIKLWLDTQFLCFVLYLWNGINISPCQKQTIVQTVQSET